MRGSTHDGTTADTPSPGCRAKNASTSYPRKRAYSAMNGAGRKEQFFNEIRRFGGLILTHVVCLLRAMGYVAADTALTGCHKVEHYTRGFAGKLRAGILQDH